MQERHFLFITAVLLFLVGAPAIYTVVREPRTLKESHNAESSESAPPAKRQVASVVESKENQKLIKSKSVILDYNCQSSGSVFEVDGTLLRLRGSSCQFEHLKEASVVNESNGFTGTVIFLKKDTFTTDFIDLQEGENQLVLQAVNEKGQPVVRKFTVQRRFPASADSEKN